MLYVGTLIACCSSTLCFVPHSMCVLHAMNFVHAYHGRSQARHARVQEACEGGSRHVVPVLILFCSDLAILRCEHVRDLCSVLRGSDSNDSIVDAVPLSTHDFPVGKGWKVIAYKFSCSRNGMLPDLP